MRSSNLFLTNLAQAASTAANLSNFFDGEELFQRLLEMFPGVGIKHIGSVPEQRLNHRI